MTERTRPEITSRIAMLTSSSSSEKPALFAGQERKPRCLSASSDFLCATGPAWTEAHRRFPQNCLWSPERANIANTFRASYKLFDLIQTSVVEGARPRTPPFCKEVTATVMVFNAALLSVVIFHWRV